ncbi:MAG: DUF2844 domain-containing protein [Limnohabitans sp.]|nr:DUF2844 domain-containing protein [Limnohabitans sp.]
MGNKQKTLMCFFVLALHTSLSYAQLGGASLLGNDRLTRLNNESITANNVQSYLINSYQTPEKTIIREYINASNRVFAVAWNSSGPAPLQLILGNYFDRYVAATSTPLAGRAPLRLQDTDLVIQTGGQMRSYFGYAYLPLLLPVGFTAEALQ